jgi:dihydroorotate dehydrogenase
MKQAFVLPIVILSLLGILDASFLTYQKINHIIPPCTPGFQCETVLNSPWANIGPVPLSALGLVFYSIVFIFAAVTLLEKKVKIGKMDNQDILMALTAFGGGFSLYLVFIMQFLIKAYCTYCLLSAIICALLFSVSFVSYFIVGKKKLYFLKNRIIATLYQPFKQLMFLADAEDVHNGMTSLGNLLGSTLVGRKLTAWIFKYHSPETEKIIDGIIFPNPIGLAAGFDYNGELTQILPSVGFGYQMVGTVTYQPYAGNKKPRLGRFPDSKALLVNKGLKSLGAVAIAKKLTPLSFEYPVGISIAATNKTFDSTRDQLLDIIKSFQVFERSMVEHSFYELNISCPNTFGGEPFTNPKRLKFLLDALSKIKINRPIYIKMPIDQSIENTMSLLKVASKYNFINGVNIGNLAKDRQKAEMTKEDKEEWQTMKGNLSGKPTFKKSNQLIKATKKQFGNRFTIIGTGGIFSPEDAKLKMKLGADLVQLISGMIFEGPQLMGMINFQLEQKELKK